MSDTLADLIAQRDRLQDRLRRIGAAGGITDPLAELMAHLRHRLVAVEADIAKARATDPAAACPVNGGREDG